MTICIFGFDNHDWFTPKDLTHVRKANLLKSSLICNRFKVKLQNEYNNLLNQRILGRLNQHYSLDEFITFNIEERLGNLNNIWQNLDITNNQLDNFERIYYAYMDSVQALCIKPDNPRDSLRRKFIRISYYSHYQNTRIPFCECCDYTDWIALTIDHANDNRIYCLNCIIIRTLGESSTEHSWVNAATRAVLN